VNSKKIIEFIGAVTGSSGRPGGGGLADNAIIGIRKNKQKAGFFIIVK